IRSRALAIQPVGRLLRPRSGGVSLVPPLLTRPPFSEGLPAEDGADVARPQCSGETRGGALHALLAFGQAAGPRAPCLDAHGRLPPAALAKQPLWRLAGGCGRQVPRAPGGERSGYCGWSLGEPQFVTLVVFVDPAIG